ncbi:RNA-directed DNA polymerase, eukaryota, reverse transcriptase zinc-binding domain protein [Tanacetum coccineum]
MDVYISEEYMVKRRMEKKAVARAKGGVSSNACKSDNNGEKMNKKGHSSSPFIKYHILQDAIDIHYYDVIITTDWNAKDMDNIIRVLYVFYLASGLKINIHKSNIYGIGVNKDEVLSMANNAGCIAGDIPFNYLGLPIGSNMKSIASWKTLVDRFHMRLSSWKANLLSIGGRLTLIKSVLGSLALQETCYGCKLNPTIIARAGQLGKNPISLSRRFCEEFHRDMGYLHCLPHTVEPRVSDHMPQIIDMINQVKSDMEVVNGAKDSQITANKILEKKLLEVESCNKDLDLHLNELEVENLQLALDFVVSETKRLKIRLILSLTNNWNSYGGKPQYVKWGNEAGLNLTNDDDFFTHQTLKSYYKSHVKAGFV